MGSGGGGGYAKSPSSFEALHKNLKSVAAHYPVTANGYFGAPGKQAKGRTRIIESDKPSKTAKMFFMVAAKDGRIVKYSDGTVTVAKFDDGSRVSYRQTSTSDGSPAVEIIIETPGRGFPKFQKIHFTKRGAE